VDPSRSWAAFEVLVVSPTPTHPPDHGNRKRIFAICDELKRRGARIHFVHYPAEHDWRHQRPTRYESEMRKAWDFYDVVAPSRELHAPATQHDHGIDEWADQAVSHHVAWACRMRSFDLVVVNYTWMSACLDAVPAAVFKVCDTHDVFGGRRALLESQGIAAEFFHTTPAEEARGLARADLVWAIKDQERDYFMRELRLSRCLTVPYAEAETGFWSGPPSTDGWLRAGVIGARNNINKRNLEQFLHIALPMLESHMAPVKIVIAGSCSDDFRALSHPNVEILGRLDQVAEFYRQVDVVVVPMQFSTGLKIKAAEALAAGAPLLALAHAMEGYPTVEPGHLLPDFRALAFELVKLSFDPTPLPALAKASRRMCRQIQLNASAALDVTRQAIVAEGRSTILLVAPASALDERCLLHDHLAAALDYLRLSAKLALFLVGPCTAITPGFLANFGRQIRVFADSALMRELGVNAPGDWTGVELHTLLDTREYERAYLMHDCCESLRLGTGTLKRVFVRHDAIAIAGGDGAELIDLVRPLVPTVVIGCDTRRLMAWRGKFGIAAVVQAPFRRTGLFRSLPTQPTGDKPCLVILGGAADPLTHLLTSLAHGLECESRVYDPRARMAAAADGRACPAADGLVMAGANLLVDLSPSNPLGAVLVEAAQRANIPVVRPLRGRVAASLYFSSPAIRPVSIAHLLRTVAAGLIDAASLGVLQSESARDLSSRVAADAGWTWLWHDLQPPRTATMLASAAS